MSRRHKLKRVDTPQHRSAITNAARILDGIDHRLAPARRYKDIIRDLSDDLGGYETLTTAQVQLVRTAAGLIVMREQCETAALNSQSVDINTFIKITNALNRILSTLGLKRTSRDRTPSLDDYLHQRGKRNGAARSSNRIRIDR